MIPALLILGSIAVFVVGVVIWNKGTGSDSVGTGENWTLISIGSLLTIVGVICALVFVISWPAQFYNSLDQNTRLEAFYDATLSAYEYAITETESVEIKGSSAGLIDVAYLEQGKAQSERVRELRDSVTWYNKTLQYRRAFKDTFFGVFALAPREDLKLIVLESP